MDCRGAPMLRAHRQLMSSTALNHRVLATVWKHQGDRLHYSSVTPSCTPAGRRNQAVPLHSRHMSGSMDPPSATGTKHSMLKSQIAYTKLYTAVRAYIAMLHLIFLVS